MHTELETECRAAIARHLAGITAVLVAALRTTLQSVPRESNGLRFEYDSPHFDQCFPVMGWHVDRTGRAVDVRKLLPDLEATIPESIIWDARYEAAGLDTWAIASELFVPWFADCWEEAGGHQFGHPAHLAHHDSNGSFDLTHRVHVRSL